MIHRYPKNAPERGLQISESFNIIVDLHKLCKGTAEKFTIQAGKLTLTIMDTFV